MAAPGIAGEVLGAMITPAVLLVREARLAIGSTLEELEFIKTVMRAP
jgi:hypothetical protein